MRRFARENAFCALLALAGCATIGWLGLYGYAWNDYDTEARAAFEALTHGDIQAFLQLAPAYGGSLVERAPFALLPGLWGGGSLALYRMVALPCLLASAALGVWLVDGMRRDGHRTLARAVALAVCVVNPITLRALGTRPSGGAARRVPVCGGGAARVPRAAGVGRARARARDRQQGVGAAGGRPGAARRRARGEAGMRRHGRARGRA